MARTWGPSAPPPALNSMQKHMMQNTTGNQALQAPTRSAALTINGFQLRDALSLIAPDGTAEQLSETLCIQPGPSRQTAQGIEAAGLYCWLRDFPDEGSVRLDETHNLALLEACQGARHVEVTRKLIAAARWVQRYADPQRQPDARALAHAILQLTRPIMDAHINALIGMAPTPVSQPSDNTDKRH